MSTARVAGGSRLPRLDGLRGVAVLCVILFHTGYFLIPSVHAGLLPGGFIGVDLFFVLSGFLMTNILLGHRQAYRSFYVRRVARIFPALYLFLLADLGYAWATHLGLAGRLRSDLLIGSGLGNWGSPLGITLPFDLGQTWSLGVEEQLYLLWPLVLVLLARGDARRAGRLCLLGIGAGWACRLAMFKAGIPAPEIYGQTEVRLDDFLAGGFVATLWVGGAPPIRRLRPLTVAAVAGLGVALAVAHPYTSPWMYEWGFTAIAIGCAVLVYAGVHQSAGTGILASTPLRAAGRYSYSAYLWHPLVILGANHLLPHPLGAKVVVAAAVLITVSFISTRFVEEPLRRLAARRTGRRPPGPGTATTEVAGAGLVSRTGSPGR